jgi:hypothetical protein
MTARNDGQAKLKGGARLPGEHNRYKAITAVGLDGKLANFKIIPTPHIPAYMGGSSPRENMGNNCYYYYKIHGAI